jgi:dipeptidyl aminopeptidase/acylaminoacyl peptidase
VTLVSGSADWNRVIVHVEGTHTAGTYQLIDFRTHKSTPLADDYPGIPDGMIGPVSIFEYTASDGLGLQGVLTLPPGRDPHGLPVVVLPHGGPETRDFLGFDWWAQAFASRGYAVFQPNFRGSAWFGTAFRNAGFGQWGRKMQTDVSDGLAALAARGIIDPQRACIVGGSYGGYVALAGVTLQRGLYRCAVSVAGVSDLKGMLLHVSVTRGRRQDVAPLRYWHKFMGVENSNSDILDSLSPINLAARADAPILLIHGKDDSVVPFDQSDAMRKALARAGKPVEFVQLEGEDHWLSRSRTRTEMLQAAVAFVERNNPPGPGGASVH